MKEQNYSNHKRLLFSYHGIVFTLILVVLFLSIYNLFESITQNGQIKESIMFFLISIVLMSFFTFARSFALKAQDRAIRAEENLRHYALIGKLFDSKIKLSQILALRFAPDEEFLELSKKAALENLSKEDIKKSIKNWKPDHNRV